MIFIHNSLLFFFKKKKHIESHADNLFTTLDWLYSKSSPPRL